MDSLTLCNRDVDHLSTRVGLIYGLVMAWAGGFFELVYLSLRVHFQCLELRRILRRIERKCGSCGHACEFMAHLRDMLARQVELLARLGDILRRFPALKRLALAFDDWQDYFDSRREDLAMATDPEFRELLTRVADGLAAKYAGR